MSAPKPLGQHERRGLVLGRQEPGNEHYAEEYGLFTSSVVLVWREHGGSTRWKNLQDVWRHLGDRNAFTSYVHGEVAAFLQAE